MGNHVGTRPFGNTGSIIKEYELADTRPGFFADFANGRYLFNGKRKAISDVITSDSGGSSVSTFTDNSGIIKWAPHNLLAYSEQFNDNYWSKTTVTVSPNVSVAPDGTSSADRFTATDSTDPKVRRVPVTSVLSGARYKYGVFAKADTADRFYFGIFWGAGRLIYTFDLTQETATVNTDNANGSATISSVGNGWYLCEMEGVRAESNPTFQISMINNADSMFFWGAHIYRSGLGGMADVPEYERGLAAAAKYLPTTTAARYLPRTDHHTYSGTSWQPAGILHETTTATNIINNSFGSFGIQSGTVTAASGVTAPDGTELNVWSVQPTGPSFNRGRPSNQSTAPGTVYAGGVYVKDNGAGYAAVVFEDSGFHWAEFNLSDGSVNRVSGAGILDYGSIYAGNGWWRIWATREAVGSGCAAFVSPSDGVNTAFGATFSTVGDNIYVWGFQTEAGRAPSSFIPSTGTPATRAADTLKIRGSVIPYNTTGMSFTMKGTVSYDGESAGAIMGVYDSATEYIATYLRNSSASSVEFFQDPGTDETVTGSVFKTGYATPVEIAWRHTTSGSQLIINGNSSTSVTTTDIGTYSADLEIGKLNGGSPAGAITLERIELFETDIADSVLAADSATAPEIISAPTVSGETRVGATLTVTAGIIFGGPDNVTTWKWQRSADGLVYSDISGATGTTYVLMPDDYDNNVRAVQTVTNSLGTISRSTVATSAITDEYAANDFSPLFVSDFSGGVEYFRVAGADSDFATAYTDDSRGAGLATQNDSTGNLVWRPHNLCINSNNFDLWSMLYSLNLTENAITAPDGTNTGWKLSENDSLSRQGTFTGSVPDGVKVTHAVFAKDAGDSRYLQIRAMNQVTSNPAAVFDLVNGTYIVNTIAGSTASITHVGDGWYRCELTVAWGDPNDLFALWLTPNYSLGSQIPNYQGDGSSGIYIWGFHAYRSDLGGMADNPDQTIAGLEKYVPTTNTVRYLTRRRHHLWDGAEWVPTLLHEPVAATNIDTDSRTFGAQPKNEVGIDGVANTATTLTDGTVGFVSFGPTYTVPDDSNPVLASVYIKKTTSASTFPGIALAFTGGGPQGGVTLNTDTGVLTDRGGGLEPDASYIEDAGGFWRVSIVVNNDSTGHTAVQFLIFPAVNDDASGSWSATFTGSVIADQKDAILNATLPSSPIITNGSTVTRTADTLKGRAASLPYSSTAMSHLIRSRLSLVDTGANKWVFNRYANDNERLGVFINSAESPSWYPVEGGSISSVTLPALTPGPSVSFDSAFRFVPGSAEQAALNGVAVAEETPSAISMPLVSAADFIVGNFGGINLPINLQVDRVSIWDKDIGTAGIEIASTDLQIEGVPTVTGDAIVSSTLTATAANTVGSPSPTVTTWQWQRSTDGETNWTNISGATAITYELTSADFNVYVRALQTETDVVQGVTFTDSAPSTAVGPITDPYAANDFSPLFVSDFSSSSDYFRVGGETADFATAYTDDSRGGGLATQVDSSGNLVWRAHNLLTYSEQLDNAAWTKFRCTVTANSIAGPDGTTTADETNQTTSQTIVGVVRQQTASQEGGALISHACFFKKKDKSFAILGTDAANATNVNDYAWFDLDSGTVETTQGGMSASISSLSDGWYLCTVTQTVRSAGGAVGGIAGSADTDGSFTVTDSGGVYIWGAHVYRSDLGGMADNPDPVATGLGKYVPTTTSARFLLRRRHHYWTGSEWAPTLLHEPVGSAQELQGDEPTDFSGSWTADGTTVVSGQSDGWGGSSAYLVYPSSSGASRRIYSPSLLSVATPTVSFVEVKASGFDWIKIEPFNAAGVWFNVSTGAVGTENPNYVGYIVDKGNGFYQCIVNSQAGSTNRLRILLCDSDNTTNATANGTDGVIVRGAQIEQGNTPSSFIPDGATARTADTCKGKAASLPYSSTAMSIAWAGKLSYNTANAQSELLLWFADGSNNIEHRLFTNPGPGGLVRWLQEESGTVDLVQNAYTGDGSLIPGVNSSFALASRHTTSAVQGASDGFSVTENSTPTALPDLSTADLRIVSAATLPVNFQVDTIRLWDEDVAEAGIVQASSPPAPYALGGTVTESGGYRYHTFTSGGTLTVTAPGEVEYLVVAGGGGAAGRKGGGGGAGGYVNGTASVSATSYTITVGAGGSGGDGSTTASAQGSDGSDSSFGAIATATGGGGGGRSGEVGNAGGSGGGGGRGAGTSSGGAGDAGGNDGGDTTASTSEGAGGGGGAGAVGQSATTADSGDGGAGSTWGDGTTYAGGGGGGGATAIITGASGSGGSGGGGDGSSAGAGVAGTANTGGGGGGGGYDGSGHAGGDGGSGIVIVRYAI